MISTLKEVREALEMLHTGLAWFKDSYPQDVNGSDDEAETEFQAALTKLDALIAAQKKAEPVAWLIEYEYLASSKNIDGSLTKFKENWWQNSFVSDCRNAEIKVVKWRNRKEHALYTAPSTSPLTDKEIAAAWLSIKDPVGLGSQFIGKNGEAVRDFVRAIESAHGIGAKP